MAKVVKHAWTHRPRSQGGTDPVEVSSTDMWFTPEFNLLSHPIIWSDSAGNSGFSGWTANLANNEYSQFYMESTANNSYLTRIVRLGPQGSIWHITPIVRTGPNCGRLRVDLATIDEDYAGGPQTLNGIGTIEPYSAATFYTLDRQNGVTYADMYQASPTNVYDGFAGANGNWHFRIMGEPGTPLTATPSFDANDGFKVNGGPGLYAIRLRVDGKNASSSAYNFRLHAWYVSRLNFDHASV